MWGQRNMAANILVALLCCFSLSLFVGAEPELVVSSGGIVVGDFSAFSKIEDLPAFQQGNSYALGELKTGSLTPLIYANGGAIKVVTEGLNGELFLGGTFFELNGVPCRNIAQFKKGEITCLSQGLDGAVDSITVLKISGGYQLLVSGVFSGPEWTSDYFLPSPNMIIWQSDKDGDRWVPLPDTLNSAPGPIIQNTDKGSTELFLGGSFVSYSGFSGSDLPHSQLITNDKTSVNCSSTETGTNCKNVFDGDLSDEKETIWLGKEGEVAFIDIDLGALFQLTKIRIANTRFENRGAKKIRIYVDGSITDVEYYNMFAETIESSSSPPLFLFPYLGFQDFYFDPIPTGRIITIEIAEFVGISGGIREIEIYRQEIVVENEFNAANSSLTKTGTWTTDGDVDDSTGTTISAEVENGKTSKLKIVPNIPLNGYYEITDTFCTFMGCAIVEYKVVYASGKSETVEVSNGAVGTYNFNIDGDFKPYVEVTVGPAFDAVGQTYYFDNMRFDPDFPPSDTFRGLARLDTATWKFSALNILEPGSSISTLYDAGDKVFVGGSFSFGLNTDNNHYNGIVYFTKADGKIGRLAQGGVGGQVYQIIGYDDENIIVAGSFITTAKDNELFLNNLAMYNHVENKWTPIGYGVDGTVFQTILVKKKLHIVGFFDLVMNSKEDPGLEVMNYAVYDFSKGEYESFFLQLGAYLKYANNKFYLFGVITSAASSLSNGIATFDGSSWESLDRGFNPQANSDYGGAAAVTTVQYLGPLGSKLYVGGAFVAKDYLTPTQRVGVYSGGKWKNVGSGFNAPVSVLKEVGGSLWAGGSFSYSQNLTSGNIIPLNGLARFDGTNWVSPGEQLSDGATVFAIEPFGINDALVGGSFQFAGMEIGCRYICHWDGSKWNDLNGGANNAVLAIASYKGRFYVGGAFTQVGCLSADRVAIWDGRQWIVPTNSGSISGNIKLIAVDTEESVFLLSSNNILYRYNVDDYYQISTVTAVTASSILSMQVVPARNTPTQDLLSRGNVLLFTGEVISMCSVVGSVVYYDGNSWYPYGLAIDDQGNPASVNNFYHKKNWSLEAWQIGVISAGVILFVLIIVLIIVLCICLKNKK